MHNACSYGHYEVCEMLILAGANVNAVDHWKFTPLHEAAAKQRIDVCSLLLRHGADPCVRNCHGKSAVDAAPNEEFRRRIIAEHRGYTFLKCVQQGEYTKVKKLLLLVQQGIPMTSSPQSATTSTIVSSSSVAVCPANSIVNDAEVLTSCAELSCSPSWQTSFLNNSKPPLPNTVNGANVAEKLISSTGNNNPTNVCLALSGSLHCNNQLIENASQSCGATTISSVSCLVRNASSQYELQNGASNYEVHPPLPPSGQPSSNAANLQNAAFLHCPNVDLIHFKNPITGEGCLHAIANALNSVSPTKRKQMTELLIRKGASLNERNNEYLSPLAIALDNGYLEIAECLLQNGARVNIADGLGQTPLHRMAHKGNVLAVQVCLQPHCWSLFFHSD